jgi:hypothetical protein
MPARYKLLHRGGPGLDDHLLRMMPSSVWSVAEVTPGILPGLSAVLEMIGHG